MEQKQNIITKDELIPSAHNHAKPMLSDAVFRPMLFSTPMVQALLAGRKTQTRRVCKLQPNADCYYISEYSQGVLTINYNQGDENPKLKCPIDVGDTIWVRESFYAWGYWLKNGFSKNGKQKWKFKDLSDDIFEYKYTNNKPVCVSRLKFEGVRGYYKRSSLFMPKSACRIWLEIINIRVEHLNYISQIDAVAEGIEVIDGILNDSPTFKNYQESGIENGYGFPHNSYFSLWDLINGKDSHKENPLVWVYDFEVVQECPHGFR